MYGLLMFLASWLRCLAPPVAGYLLGTVPSADLAASVAGGPDLRDTGSGNPGAANAVAVLGPRFGLAVLVADIAKGAAAGRLGRSLNGPAGADLAATAAVVGHCHPVWSGFRGGKGVATSVGQVLATFPVYFPIDAAVAIATSASPRWRQRAFAGTGVASLVWVGATTLWWRRRWPTAPGRPATVTLPLGALVSTVVILNRFRAAAASSAASAATEPSTAGEPVPGS